MQGSLLECDRAAIALQRGRQRSNRRTLAACRQRVSLRLAVSHSLEGADFKTSFESGSCAAALQKTALQNDPIDSKFDFSQGVPKTRSTL